MPVGDLSAFNISRHGWFTVYVSTPNQAEKNAHFGEVFKWGHSMGAFVRVWKIIRIDEPGLLK